MAFQRLKHWARALKREVVALWIAARDPRMPVSAHRGGDGGGLCAQPD